MNKTFFFCAFCLFGQLFFAHGQIKITFKTGKFPLSKTGKTRLYLAGDFNNWNPRDSTWEMVKNNAGDYRLFKELKPGTYHFKVTRGSWNSVECNRSGMAIDNRSITLFTDTVVKLIVEQWQDNFTAPEKRHTATAQVNIINEKFEIPQLGRQRRVWIYLPKDYHYGKKNYPVIYMQDGQNLFDEYTSGYGEWGIDEIMDKLESSKESIIVGIDHGGEDRITEYDPFDSKYGKGRGDDYVNFLVQTLKPYIDSHYRTISDAAHTTIAGSSMGGLIALYAAVKYPGTFGNAGVFSPALWIAAPQMFDFVQHQDISEASRFYFVCGDAESESMVPDMQKMAGIIRSKGLTELHTPTVIINGARHDEKQWNNDFPGFYQWLLAK